MNISRRQWNKVRLESLVVDRVPESQTLEYKAFQALDLSTDKNKAELAKDVSAMANSAGGTILYGVDEERGSKPPVASRISGVPRGRVSELTIENVLTSRIQPIVRELKIYAVHWDDPDGSVVWVVDVPQGQTAHQANVGTYYYRHNFKCELMPDYLVRDVMQRGLAPKLDVQVNVRERTDTVILEFGVTNASLVAADGFALELVRPDGAQEYVINQGNGTSGFKVRFHRDVPGQRELRSRMWLYCERKLFPGQTVDLSMVFSVTWHRGSCEEPSKHSVLSWNVFCDRRLPASGTWDPLQLAVDE